MGEDFCTENLTTEMEQPCNRIILYLAGECEDNDMWLFCGEELSNYLRNHDLEDEPFLKQTGCLPYVIMYIILYYISLKDSIPFRLFFFLKI